MRAQKALSVYLLIFVSSCLVMTTPAFAEFIPHLGYEAFQDIEGLLVYPADSDSPMYRVDAMDASEMETRNGIIFSGEGESSVRIKQGEDMLLLGGWEMGPRCIEHIPSSESSWADEGIIIRFKYPVVKFGLYVGRSSFSGPGVEGVAAITLTAYSPSGQLVGTTLSEREYLGEGEYEFADSTLGFELTSGPGVTTVILDYNEDHVRETIGKIYYEYLDPRPFRVILPQIAHGNGNGAAIESDLMLFWDRSAEVSVFSSDGDFFPLPVLEEGNSFTLPLGENSGLPKSASRQFFFKSTTIPGLNDLSVGYVVAESDYPIDGQVVYRTTDARGKVYEADIRGCVPETYLQIPFELNQAENLDAALAIVNPSDTVAEVEIHVNDEEKSYTEFWDPPAFTLQPGEHRALFMWELWNELPSEDGNYILQLRSAVPFAAAAFYTRNGIVVGNLPVWSYKEGQAR